MVCPVPELVPDLPESVLCAQPAPVDIRPATTTDPKISQGFRFINCLLGFNNTSKAQVMCQEATVTFLRGKMRQISNRAKSVAFVKHCGSLAVRVFLPNTVREPRMKFACRAAC